MRGTLTVHDRKVYAVTAESWVCGYDADTGEPLWSRPLDEQYREGRPLAINQTPPVPTRHGLLVSDWQAPQYLLEWKTGEELARLDGNVGYYAAFATVFGDVMFCARRGGSLAMQTPSGKTLWSQDESSRSTSAGIVAGDKFVYASQSGVKAVNAKTGQPIWEAAVANNGYQKPIPVIWDDLVLASGAAFTALDLATGQPRWSVDCGQQAGRFVRSRRHVLAGSSTPIIAGDFAYFGHDDTSLRAVDCHGEVVWEHCVGTPIKTAPAVSGDLLFVHDFAGNLWCFEPVRRARTQEPTRRGPAARSSRESRSR
jgi:outer membrane protein assembly factor BamB